MALGKDEGNDTIRSQQESSTSKDAPFEPKKLSGHKNIPPALQRIVDQVDEDESIYEDSWAPKRTEPNESIVRYAAYASRIKTLLYSMQRYVAYTSDISESLRPLAQPNLIRGAYAISWSYMLGDAAQEGHKAYRCNQVIHLRRCQQPVRQNRGIDTEATDITRTAPGITPALEDHRTVAMQRFLFHCMASVALPTFTVQHIVRYTNNIMRSAKSKALRTGGPLGASLLLMPFFPHVFDKPVEKAVEWIFYKGFQKFGGQDAVGPALQTGRTEELRARAAALRGLR